MATYFARVKSLEDLKSQYRALAMQHHPDRGGDVKIMQDINMEYDEIYQKYQTYKVTDSAYESAEKTRHDFYRSQGWEGRNYDPELWPKDIAKVVKAYTKKHWSGWKLSIRTDYSGMNIHLMSAPANVWADESAPEYKREIEIRKLQDKYYEPSKCWEKGNLQVNHYHVDSCLEISPIAKMFFQDIIKFVSSYNYDHSDNMRDYFDRGFYTFYEIGRYNKPFVQTGNLQYADSKEVKVA